MNESVINHVMAGGGGSHFLSNMCFYLVFLVFCDYRYKNNITLSSTLFYIYLICDTCMMYYQVLVFVVFNDNV